jgi:hypothetical protein
VKPTSGLARLRRDQDYLLSPLGDSIERVINAIGVGEAVAFCDHVTLPARLEKIDSAPKASFIET